MSALFFGEFLYQFLCENKVILSIIAFVGFFIITFILKWICQVTRKLSIIFSMIFFMFYCIGIYRCGIFFNEISNIDRELTDQEKVIVSGKVAKIEAGKNSKKVYLSDGEILFRNKKLTFGKTILIIQDKIIDKYQNKNSYQNKNNYQNSKNNQNYDNQAENSLFNVKIGNVISAEATYSKLTIPTNDGGFDEKSYYHSLGIFTKFITQPDNVKIVKRRYYFINQTLYQIKNYATKRINSLCNSKYAAVYVGMLLGDKTDIDEETNNLYKLAGISHLLAISGLHISAIGMLIFKLMRKKLGYYSAGTISIIIVNLYGIMTGNSISARRAVIMFSINIIAAMLGRTYDIWTAISGAFVLLIFENPYCIQNSGLILSFSAIVALILLYDSVIRFLRVKNKLLKALLSGISVNIFTKPVIISYYFEFPLYSSLVNVIVIPLSGTVLVLGFLGLGVSYLNFYVGHIILKCGCYILKLYEVVSEFSLKLPFSNIIVGKPSTLRIILYYGIMLTSIIIMKLILYFENKMKTKNHGKQKYLHKGINEDEKEEYEFYHIRYTKRFACILIGFILLFIAIQRKDKEMGVKVIDVGQGDSIFIQTDMGETFLLDAGSSSKNEISKYCILPFLKANGVRQLNYLIMSHSDEDHINGMMDLLNYKVNGKNYVKNFIVPQISKELEDENYLQLIKTAVDNNIPVIKAFEGFKIAADHFEMTCLNPLNNNLYSDKNDSSLVFSLKIEETRMLLMADISENCENLLINKEMIENADIVKVAHHGANTASSEKMLQKINPRVALISCALRNRYGHPGKETIERLVNHKTEIFYTMRSGQINVYFRKKAFSVETFLD